MKCEKRLIEFLIKKEIFIGILSATIRIHILEQRLFFFQSKDMAILSGKRCENMGVRIKPFGNWWFIYGIATWRNDTYHHAEVVVWIADKTVCERVSAHQIPHVLNGRPGEGGKNFWSLLARNLDAHHRQHMLPIAACYVITYPLLPSKTTTTTTFTFLISQSAFSCY